MIPSEEDRQSRFDHDSTLRLVSRDRHRLHRSTSRQPARSTSARRNRSPERWRSGREIFVVVKQKQQPQVSAARQVRVTAIVDIGGQAMLLTIGVLIRMTWTTTSWPATYFQLGMWIPDLQVSLQFVPERGRPKTPAEQLEARRQSLTRRPSVPNVPLQIKPSLQVKVASTSIAASSLVRSHTDDGPVTLSNFNEYFGAGEASGLGVVSGRPTTPRAMQVDTAIPGRRHGARA